MPKFIFYLYPEGKELEYFFLGDYAITLFMGDVVNYISVSKLNEKELKTNQKHLEEYI